MVRQADRQTAIQLHMVDQQVCMIYRVGAPAMSTYDCYVFLVFDVAIPSLLTM